MILFWSEALVCVTLFCLSNGNHTYQLKHMEMKNSPILYLKMNLNTISINSKVSNNLLLIV